MKDLFLKRKQAFRKECVGYLRYVLNDHFVLFLLVLIGFLLLKAESSRQSPADRGQEKAHQR